MYFKLNNDNNLFNELIDYIRISREASDLHHQFQQKIGAESRGYFNGCGHIVGFKFNTPPPPELGLKFHKKTKYWMPDISCKAGRDLAEQLKQLPPILSGDFKKVINFKPYTRNDSGNLKITTSPGFEYVKGKDVMLFEYPDGYPEPVPEAFIEITYTEYQKLKSN